MTWFQCKSEDGMKDLRCQGVPKHSGPHWAYDQAGHLIMWKNKREKDPEWEIIACAWIPPDADDYIHPKDMYNKHYITIGVEKERVKKDAH